jgi:hypothetical protein
LQRQRRARKPARNGREPAARRREQAAARHDDAVSRRDEALARRDEKLAARGAPGTRGRGNVAKPLEVTMKPVKVRKAPGSSRSLRAPAKKPLPVTTVKPERTPKPKQP